MITNNRTFYLGIFLLIIPLLGFPLSWKFALVMLSGIGLIALSIKIHFKWEVPAQFHIPAREGKENKFTSYEVQDTNQKENEKKTVKRPKKKKEDVVTSSLTVAEPTIVADSDMTAETVEPDHIPHTSSIE